MRIPRSRFLYAAIPILILAGFSSPREVSMSNLQSDALQEQSTRDTIQRFNESFNRHDADGVEKLLSDNTVFEDTSPAPDGRRIEGKKDVADFWRAWFAKNPDAKFESEEMFVSGNRATVLWVYRKMKNGQPWHLRGVDVFSVKDGKVAAKLAYVKG